MCRYQLQGERLQVENIKLTEELDSQKTSLQDINEFLTNELKAKTAATNVLEERITSLETKLKQQKGHYEVIGCSMLLLGAYGQLWMEKKGIVRKQYAMEDVYIYKARVYIRPLRLSCGSGRLKSAS